MQILGIAGSLRTGSYNRQLLRLAAENLSDGVELAVWEGLAAFLPSMRTTRARRHSRSRVFAPPSQPLTPS